MLLHDLKEIRLQKEVYFMKNPCGSRWEQPGIVGSPIGKGQKTKEKVKSVLGKKGTVKKFITG
jgi:hypothetical protein